MDKYYFYNERTVCCVLDEMRKCDQVKNYAPLLSLIEEVQIMADRMESGLGTKSEIRQREEHLTKLKKEIKKLEEKQRKCKK